MPATARLQPQNPTEERQYRKEKDQEFRKSGVPHDGLLVAFVDGEESRRHGRRTPADQPPGAQPEYQPGIQNMQHDAAPVIGQRIQIEETPGPVRQNQGSGPAAVEGIQNQVAPTRESSVLPPQVNLNIVVRNEGKLCRAKIGHDSQRGQYGKGEHNLLCRRGARGLPGPRARITPTRFPPVNDESPKRESHPSASLAWTLCRGHTAIPVFLRLCPPLGKNTESA